jgi:hypothetical protein
MAFPSDLVRTKDWGTEILTDADLEGQFDLIIDWVMASMNSSTGHKHDATSNEAPKINTISGLTVTSQAQGDILYADSVSSFARLAPGTSGQVLQTQGAAADPIWSGSTSELVSNAAFSNDATFEVTGLAAGFDYIFVIQNLAPQTDVVTLNMRTSTDGGATYDSGAANYRYGGATDTLMVLTGPVGNATNESASWDVTLYNPSDTTFTQVYLAGARLNGVGTFAADSVGGQRESATDVDAVQFLMSSGNIVSGNISVHRRANA